MAEFDLTRSDYFSASWFLQRHRRLRMYLGASMVTLGAGMILGDYWVPLGTAILVAGVGAAIWVSLWLLTSRQRILRIYDDNLAKSSHCSLTLNERGFEVEAQSGSAKVEWSELKFWSENDRFFFLYRGRDYAQIIPISCLSEEEIAFVRKKTAALKDI